MDLRELTSVRFFAAFYVVVYHVFQKVPALMTLDSGLFSSGYLGVDLFFMLSGVILMHVHQIRPTSYANFMRNRLARIYPLHLVMIIIYVAAYAAGRAFGLTADAAGERYALLPQHLLLIHAWGTTPDQFAWNGASWSISAELFAYLLFPAFLLFHRRLTPVWGMILSAMLFLALDAYAMTTGIHLTDRTYDFGILRILPEFLFGMFLYRAAREAKPLPLPGFAFAISVITFFIFAHFEAPPALLVGILAGMLYILCVSAIHSPIAFMQHPALVYLGEISYSTYMVHQFVIMIALAAFPKVLGLEVQGWVWLLVFAMIYIASACAYHLVELPARQAIRRGLLKHRTVGGEASTAV